MKTEKTGRGARKGDAVSSNKPKKNKTSADQDKKLFSLVDLPLMEKLGRILVFCSLLTVELVLAVNNRDMWMVIVPTEIVLTTENAVKVWGLKKYKQKIICYVMDFLLLLVLTVFSDGSLISVFYVIILSEFYLSQKSLTGSVAMCASSIVSFLVTFAIRNAILDQNFNVLSLLVRMINDLFILAMHFLVFNFAVQVFRKNREVTAALKELNATNEKLNATNEQLNASNEKLRKAMEEANKVAILEERQRIAKDIHDTVGHSITTVITQTEAAKLIIDSDEAEAKKKITTANLQAKHALEELRESVHLLSGLGGYHSLQEALQGIINESTDGTDIVIRSDIQDIALCDAKSRFLQNTLKEGISNGLRHGGATAFYFELKQSGGNVEFLLSDNGTGIGAEGLQAGFGLTTMRSRTEALGGTLSFESEPDEGFEIHLTLPTDRPESATDAVSREINAGGQDERN